MLTLLHTFFNYFNTDPLITKSETEAIVEQCHANSFDTVEIISINYERENEGNCEWDVDYMYGQSGEIEMG